MATTAIETVVMLLMASATPASATPHSAPSTPVASLASPLNEKPQCGGGSPIGEYDVGLHVAGLFLVLAASCAGAGFPVVARKITWLRIPKMASFICKHFGTGVLIATAFVHLVPTAFMSLLDPCLPDLFTENYPPMPGVIMMAAMFMLFVVEVWMQSQLGGHSHGIPKSVELDDASMIDMDPSSPTKKSSTYIDVETGEPVSADVYKKMAMNIALIEGGILFHSVFVGITVSLTVEGYVVLLIAILFHQMFEGLGLGARIAAVPYPRGSIRPWLLVFAFGTTAPIGQAIGLAVRNAFDPSSAVGLITVGVFNAISSGILLYGAMVDLLAEDFLSEHAQKTMTSAEKKKAFAWVLLGAAGMAIVGAFA